MDKVQLYETIGFRRDIAELAVNNTYETAEEFCNDILKEVRCFGMIPLSLDEAEAIGYQVGLTYDTSKRFGRLIQSFKSEENLRDWFISFVSSIWNFKGC